MRSEKVRITNKVILLILLLDQLHHVLGIILAITHLLIIIICTWKHIWFNILLHIQIMVNCKDWLLTTTIWSKIMYVLLSNKLGVAMSKIIRVCSRDGVPQAYPALKKGDYSGCESKEQWSNLQRLHQQGQQLRRYGDQNKLFHEFIASSWPIKQLSPLGEKYGRCI
jgi:hypothetical protein